jgi:predicted ribosome quality control (RQC) complex YloA/Tae2 family protein
MDADEERDDARSPAAYVQEASSSERVVLLKVRAILAHGTSRDENWTAWIVVARTGVGLLSPDARRETWGAKLPPGAIRQRAREESLTGATVLALGTREAFIDQRGDPRVVRAIGDRVVVTDDRPPADARPFAALSADERRVLEARGLEIAAAAAADALSARQDEAIRILDRAAARIERRQGAIRGDLAKIAQADRIAAQAQWLVGEAAKTPRGATKLVVTDWSTGEPVPLEIPLDPAKSAKAQVAAMFKRAKRLRLGARIAEERLSQTETQLLGIWEAKDRAREATSLVALEEVLRNAKTRAPRDVTLPEASGSGGRTERAKGPQKRTAYRTFVAGSGRKILVGKGATDNDELTLHVARPHDTWLHAKDRTGAHVIVPIEKGRTCPSDDLVEAAHLAAHFSDARDEKAVDVQYTDRRYLRKPKGSPPGFVIVDRERVLALRMEPERLRSLLEREEL